MQPLKLIALEAEDLEVISATLQDAVMRVGDMTFLKSEGRFACIANRFAWETGRKERRRTGLDFCRVNGARLKNIDPKQPDQVLNLLALRFIVTDSPSGVVEFIFSGDAAIQLDVECLEARLKDLGGAWKAALKPRHPVS